MHGDRPDRPRTSFSAWTRDWAASRRRSFRIPGWRRVVGTLSALGVALLAGACGLSATLGLPGVGASADARTGTKTDTTDLISALSTGAFSDADLVAASTATAALMARGKGGRWENPQTGARGAIAPIAAAYRDNGVECRDFLVSYVHDTAEAWMQGEACRGGDGRWVVRRLKPWRR